MLILTFGYFGKFYLSSNAGVRKHTCGGTILTTYYVITAAHCFFNRTRENWRILPVYKLDAEEGTFKVHTVAEIKCHESYTNGYQYDIAIVKVSEPFEKKEVKALHIPPTGTKPKDFERCQVAGWGETLALALPTKLQFIEIPIQNIDKCKRNYIKSNASYEERFYDGFLCAGSEGKDSCQV